LSILHIEIYFKLYEREISKQAKIMQNILC